jgi:hypothetical protein
MIAGPTNGRKFNANASAPHRPALGSPSTSGDQPHAQIDHADGYHVVRQALLDLIDDAQRLEPRLPAREDQHEATPQRVPADEEEEQRCQEQDKLADCRRQKAQHGLDESGDVDPRSGVVTAGGQGMADVTQRGQRAREDLQLVCHRRRDVRRFS